MFNPQPIILQRGTLCLAPMQEADIAALANLVEANRQALLYMRGSQCLDWYREGLQWQRDGKALCFVIRLGEQLVGTIRLGDFMPALPAVEIGWTWLDQHQHSTGLNTNVKYLMFKHAFEHLGVVRVRLKTASSNLRAQRAIEKLGAVREGVLRNHRHLADGRLDDSVLYSITDHDWPAIKQQLEARFSG